MISRKTDLPQVSQFWWAASADFGTTGRPKVKKKSTNPSNQGSKKTKRRRRQRLQQKSSAKQTTNKGTRRRQRRHQRNARRKKEHAKRCQKQQLKRILDRLQSNTIPGREDSVPTRGVCGWEELSHWDSTKAKAAMVIPRLDDSKWIHDPLRMDSSWWLGDVLTEKTLL